MLLTLHLPLVLDWPQLLLRPRCSALLVAGITLTFDYLESTRINNKFVFLIFIT